MLQYSAPTTYQKSGHFAGVARSESERDALITAHLGTVKYIADRFAAKLPPSVERDDLYGAGVVGLIEAVERFDASRGIAFTTFAELRVRGAILDNLRSLDWASRTTRRRAREIQETFARIEQEEGRSATEEEVALKMKISLAELRESLQDLRGLKVTDLDERDEETGLSALDTVRDSAASPLEEIEGTQNRRLLAQAIDKLPERERQVVALYYLEELTMKEIGAVLNVTESRVSQLRTQAIVRLRANLPK
jgi:RNA polymerase sigma factor for flagellar operon FliA